MAWWEQRELAWPESADFAADLERHSASTIYGYAGGKRPTKTDYCFVCNRRKPRSGMWEWRDHLICADCFQRVRPVTVHATWTELLPIDELAEAGQLEVSARKLGVERIADVPAIIEVKLETPTIESELQVLQRPRVDVWVSDGGWAGQVLRDRATGEELDRNTQAALPYRVGQTVQLAIRRKGRTKVTEYQVTSVEDAGDTVFLETTNPRRDAPPADTADGRDTGNKKGTFRSRYPGTLRYGKSRRKRAKPPEAD